MFIPSPLFTMTTEQESIEITETVGVSIRTGAAAVPC